MHQSISMRSQATKMKGFALAASLLTALAPAVAFGQTAVTTTVDSTPPILIPLGGSTPTVTVDLRNGDDPISPGGVTATYSWSNQQYPGSNPYVSSGNPAFFGRDSRSAAPENIWVQLRQMGGAAANQTGNQFTAVHDGTPGMGVNVTTTYGSYIGVQPPPLDTPGFDPGPQDRFRIADLHIDFDHPVAYPVLHFHGLGGAYPSSTGLKGVSAEFDFIPNAEASVIRKLSGNGNFSVGSGQIRNTAANISTSCNGAGTGACGSVVVEGENVTSITLRTYISSNDATLWDSLNPGQHLTDGFTIGFSAETADMVPSFSNLPAEIVNGTTYAGLNLTCRNQGPNRAYGATCAPVVDVGTISNLVCTPPSPASGPLAANGEISCSFSYRRDSGSGAESFTGRTSASNDRDGGTDVTAGNNQIVQMAPLGDFSDAPASYGVAGHLQSTPGALRMGALLDVEPGPFPSSDATGDDANGLNDEDGVTFTAVHPVNGLPMLIAGQSQLVMVDVTGSGYLNVWLDVNGDGEFTYEQVIISVTDGDPWNDADPTPGRIGFYIYPPVHAARHGESFMRFRWSPDPLWDHASIIMGGEVEDYRVWIENPADIRLDMEVSNLEPLLGETFFVDLILTSEASASATNVMTTYLPPAGYAFSGSPEFSGTGPAGSYDPTTGLWTAGDIPSGQTRKLRIPLKPMTPATLAPVTHVAEVMSHAHEDVDSIPGNGVPTEDDYDSAVVTARSGTPLPPGPLACSANLTALDWAAATLNSGSSPAAQFSFAGTEATLFVSPPQDVGWPVIRSFGANQGLELSGVGGYVEITLNFSQPVGNLRLPLQGFAPVSADHIVGLNVQGARGGGFVPAFITGGAGVSLVNSNLITIYNPAYGVADYQAVLDFGQMIDSVRIRVESARVLADLSQRWELAPWRLELGGLASCLAPPVLTPNHESTVPPGQLVIYEHQLTLPSSFSGNALSFETTSEQGLNWRIFIDDGDGIFNGALDAIWPQGSTIVSGVHRFWLVAQVPHNAAAGWRDLTRLRAGLTQGGFSAFAEVQDVTRVGGALEGQIHAQKSVALDADCDGQPDLGDPGFVSEVSVINAVCVLYRVSFENRSVTPISKLRVHDHTPDWTTHIGGSATAFHPPPGLLPLVIEQPADGGAGTISFVFDGALEPGESGLVQFGVKVSGTKIVTPSGGGTPPNNPN